MNEEYYFCLVLLIWIDFLWMKNIIFGWWCYILSFLVAYYIMNIERSKLFWIYIYIYIYIYIERKKNFTFFLSGRIRKILLIAIFSRPSGKAWKKGSNGTIPPSPQNERGDLVVLGLWRYVVRCSVFFHWGQT